MDIYDKVESIKNKTDFVAFLEMLLDDLNKNREDWENDRLESFLDGIYGYSMCNVGDDPSWKLFAEILLTSRVYE